MSYCDVQDIEAYYLGKSFECDDYLKNIEVSMLISQDAALIDAFIRVKYTLPLIQTNDLQILKMINELLVVGRIDDIFREKSDDTSDVNKFDRRRNARKEGMDLLKQVRDGDILLNTGQGASVIKFNNINSDGEEVTKRFKDSNIEPNIFTIDRENRTVTRVS